MIHNWSCEIVDYLMHRTQILDSSRRLNYCYKVETILGKLIASILVLLLGLAIWRPAEAAIFLLVSIKLGDYTGGYHTKNPVRCNLLTMLTFIATVLATDLILESATVAVCALLAVLSAIPVFMYAPVNHPDLNLDDDEINNARWKSRALYVVLMVITGVATMVIPATYSICCVVTISFVSIFIILAKITKQEVPQNEEKQKDFG